MKRLPFPTAKALLAGAATLSLGCLFAPEASATDYVFSGVGDWYTSGANPNWSPDVTGGLDGTTLTIAGNTASIQGMVNYNGGPAGDFKIGNGDTMIIDGTESDGTAHSWTQTASTGNWIKIGASGGTGTVIIQNGGNFNANGGLLRIGEDGGNGVITVTSTAGSGGLKAAVNTETSANATINLQGGTNSFAQLQLAGTMNVSGGNTTMSGALQTSTTTVINLSAGTFSTTGSNNVSLNSAAQFTLSGTATFRMTGTGEFQPGFAYTAGQGSNQSISGSAVLSIAGVVAFQGNSNQKFDINGGSVIIGGTGTATSPDANGIFTNGAYFNFTTGSMGKIDLTNVSVQNAIADINGGKIRFNDARYTTDNYSSAFTVTSDGGNGSLIYLLGSTAVPEPSTWLGGALLLGSAGWMRRGLLRGFLQKARAVLG